jgi:hypothetical protein
MDHDITASQNFAPSMIKAKPVPGDVTLHDQNTAFDLWVEMLSQLGAQAVKTVVPDDLLLDPPGCAYALPWSYEKGKLTTGNAAEQAFN